MSDAVRIVIWNVGWATPNGRHGTELARRIERENPDVVCLTETPADFSLPGGHTITSDADYGYVPKNSKHRKVLLWSREPWRGVDQAAKSDLPSGRFVRGRTITPAGLLAVWGVCVPWFGAHVSSGRRDRARWQDHLTYLAALGGMLDDESGSAKIVLGDFNQRVPPMRTAVMAARALKHTLKGLQLATPGILDDHGRLLIDHLAHSRDLSASEVRVLSADHAGGKLSDHVGVALQLEA